MTTFDGNQTYVPVGGGAARKPRGGDIIEIKRGTDAAGTRPGLTISNLFGTASSRIIVRGDRSGLVTIRRSDTSTSFVVTCASLRYVTIDGYLASAASERYCGLKIMYSSYAGQTAPVSFLNLGDSSLATQAAATAGNPLISSFVTIRYVSINGGHTWPIADSKTINGIGIQINDHGSLRYTDNCVQHGVLPNGASTSLPHGTPTLYREGITVENCWVRNVQGEGMYIGPNWRWTSPDYPVADADDLPLRNMIVRYNRLDEIGGDVINAKSWVAGDNRIHGNRIYFGTTEMGDDGDHVIGGISGNNIHVKIYDNYIDRCAGPAITAYMYQMPDSLPFGPFVAEVYNNVVSDIYPTAITTARAINISASGVTGPAGTPVAGDSVIDITAKIYNNTVADVDGTGISCTGSAAGSFVRGNLVAGATTPITGGVATVTNNWTGTVANARFVNYTGVAGAGRDFNLQSSSPGVGILTSGYPATDIVGTSRPRGTNADAGAYECIVP